MRASPPPRSAKQVACALRYREALGWGSSQHLPMKSDQGGAPRHRGAQQGEERRVPQSLGGSIWVQHGD